MNNVMTRRPQGPISELMDWLETEVPFGLRRIGLTPAMPVEDFEDGDTYVVRAELPGLDPEKDIAVTLTGDMLTIRGERKEIQRHRRLQEIQYGSFSRSLRVPTGTDADDIRASYRNGVLEVRVPIGLDGDAEPKVIGVRRDE